jgi:hypothetical protein
MLTRHFVTAFFIAGLSGIVIADEAHHPAGQPTQPPTASPAPQDSVPVREADMHARMMRMHDEMAKIMAATDAKEKGRLMEEHMKSMHEVMSMMPAMMSCK